MHVYTTILFQTFLPSLYYHTFWSVQFKDAFLDRKMPRVDAIGISSAGVYIDNKIMVASLFNKVDKTIHGDYVKNMYINVAKEIGDVPIMVANDGDVTALAGSMALNDVNVLGIAIKVGLTAGYQNLRLFR